MAFSRKLVTALTQFSSLFQLGNRSPNFIFSENCALQEARVTSVSPCSGGLNENEPPHGLSSVEVGEESLKLQESLLLKIGLLPPIKSREWGSTSCSFSRSSELNDNSATNTRRTKIDAQMVAK